MTQPSITPIADVSSSAAEILRIDDPAELAEAIAERIRVRGVGHRGFGSVHIHANCGSRYHINLTINPLRNEAENRPKDAPGWLDPGQGVTLSMNVFGGREKSRDLAERRASELAGIGRIAERDRLYPADHARAKDVLPEARVSKSTYYAASPAEEQSILERIGLPISSHRSANARIEYDNLSLPAAVQTIKNVLRHLVVTGTEAKGVRYAPANPDQSIREVVRSAATENGARMMGEVLGESQETATQAEPTASGPKL